MSVCLTLNLLLLLVVSTYTVPAQHITIKGTVVNESAELVEAHIRYESLPYGSRVGLFDGSRFQFKLVGNSRYMLEVSAPGYAPYQEILDLTSPSSLEIRRTIELRRRQTPDFIALDKIMFDIGKDRLSERSRRELDKLVYMFSRNNDILIHLEGHSDFRGNDRLNMLLSKRRVDTVKQYLISHGVNENCIKTVALGGSQPLSNNNDLTIGEKNRRVEVKVFNYN